MIYEIVEVCLRYFLFYFEFFGVFVFRWSWLLGCFYYGKLDDYYGLIGFGLEYWNLFVYIYLGRVCCCSKNVGSLVLVY